MSAWAVFAALGFHPAIPGTDVLAFGSPLFRKATLRLPGGTLRIAGRRAARDRPYVRSLTIDGVDHSRPWVSWREIEGGATLVFDLDDAPEAAWGAAPEDAPPSFGPDGLDPCVP
jgi:putative alpha-1,2-mannosidase